MVNNENPGAMAINHCFPSCSHAHLIPWKPPNTSYLPLWHYLQTAADSCLFAPPSQCATHCHSASALRTASLVLCLSWRRGGRGFKIINYKGNAAPLTTPTQTGIVFRQLETTEVEKTCIFDAFHTAYRFSWYRQNRRMGKGKRQIRGFYEIKILRKGSVFLWNVVRDRQLCEEIRTGDNDWRCCVTNIIWSHFLFLQILVTQFDV